MAATHLAVDLGLSGAAEELNDDNDVRSSSTASTSSSSHPEYNKTKTKSKSKTKTEAKAKPKAKGEHFALDDEDDDDDGGDYLVRNDDERSVRMLRMMSKAVGFETDCLTEEEAEEEEDEQKHELKSSNDQASSTMTESTLMEASLRYVEGLDDGEEIAFVARGGKGGGPLFGAASPTDRAPLGAMDSSQFHAEPELRDQIEDEVFKKHTKWFGLVFRGPKVERTFKNGHARFHRKVVYTGYLIQFLIGLVLLVESAASEFYRASFCATQQELGGIEGAIGTQFCMEMFALPEDEVGKFRNTWKFFAWCSIGITCFVGLGMLLNWYIHSDRVREKFWAIWAVFAIYAMELVFMILAILLSSRKFYMWPFLLFVIYVLLFTVSLWFTGTLFIHNLILFVGAGAIYLGLSIPLVVEDAKTAATDVDPGSFAAFWRTLLYLACAPLSILFALLLLVGSYLDELTCRKRFLQRVMIAYQQGRIIKHKTRSESLQKRLLENMLPSCIVDELRKKNYTINSWDELKSLSKRHLSVSIMFADIVGFTQFSSEVDPSRVMVFLNDLFFEFDNLCEEYNVYKVETVGDCYVAAVGIVTGDIVTTDYFVSSVTTTNALSRENSMSKVQKRLVESQLKTEGEGSGSEDGDGKREEEGIERTPEQACERNTDNLVGFAKEILCTSRTILKPKVNSPTVLRIGIHTGSVMSGLVGTKNLRFCLFGDTMNTAARMEQNAMPDTIQASEAVKMATPLEKWRKREGLLEVKGKGKMQTYFLHPE